MSAVSSGWRSPRRSGTWCSAAGCAAPSTSSIAMDAHLLCERVVGRLTAAEVTSIRTDAIYGVGSRLG